MGRDAPGGRRSAPCYGLGTTVSRGHASLTPPPAWSRTRRPVRDPIIGRPIIAEFDLIVRNGRVATATSVIDADIGVRNGRITAIAPGLVGALRELDARDRWVLPGGI